MDNKLTDKTFWKTYWERKKDVLFRIPENFAFHHVLSNLVKTNHVKDSIELGGFPGYQSIYLKKYLQVQPTLLDYYIHPEILTQLIQLNGLEKDDIQVIEADLFQYEPRQQYDLVFSIGLIEHFEDTKDIIGRHLPFLKPGGALFLNLPNFRGVNGWFQRKFDIDNYNKHNIKSMDVALLKKACEELGLQKVKVYYFGHFSIWLENYETQSPFVKAFFKLTWLIGKAFTKAFSIESKAFSPYIFIEARKQEAS